jgi:hypothetical protein
MAGTHTNIPNKPIPALSEKDVRRFWAKVDKRGPDECWPWTAGVTRDGYGRFGLTLRDRVNTDAEPRARYSTFQTNRIAYFLEHGIDPGDNGTLHRCDNPPCVNPSHLFDGTQSENSQDRVRKERQARGERDGNSKLTQDAVLAVLRLRASGMTYKRVAAEIKQTFNIEISLCTAFNICAGDTWMHVTGLRRTNDA